MPMFNIRRFTACDSDPALSKFLDNHTPVESIVTLKVGAQVMLLKNLNVSTTSLYSMKLRDLLIRQIFLLS